MTYTSLSCPSDYANDFLFHVEKKLTTREQLGRKFLNQVTHGSRHSSRKGVSVVQPSILYSSQSGTNNIKKRQFNKKKCHFKRPKSIPEAAGIEMASRVPFLERIIMKLDVSGS